MIFYSFLGLVLLGVGSLIFRSPTFKALMRGRGADPGRYGRHLDHLYDQGGQAGWNDDGGGRRASRRDPPQSRRHDQEY